MLKKPKRVLCKRSQSSGDDYMVVGYRVVPRDNLMLVEGEWYDVVYNKNDKENTFSIIDNQGNLHLHYMYTEEDKKNWPDFCDKYGPRDYSKWFYTLEELRRLKIKSICTK